MFAFFFIYILQKDSAGSLLMPLNNNNATGIGYWRIKMHHSYPLQKKGSTSRSNPFTISEAYYLLL